MSSDRGQNGPMDVREQLARLAAHVDRHHPRLGSRILRARFGGLRVLEPNRTLASVVVAAGVASGVGTAEVLRRVSSGRVRAPRATVALAGPAVMWAALWRWDAVRWRRRHVVLVLDLPSATLDRVVAELVGDGLHVERWDGPRRPGGAASGLSCRLADLRLVNSRLDASTRPTLGGSAG